MRTHRIFGPRSLSSHERMIVVQLLSFHGPDKVLLLIEIFRRVHGSVALHFASMTMRKQVGQTIFRPCLGRGCSCRQNCPLASSAAISKAMKDLVWVQIIGPQKSIFSSSALAPPAFRRLSMMGQFTLRSTSEPHLQYLSVPTSQDLTASHLIVLNIIFDDRKTEHPDYLHS